jgi:hypothetical protein
MGTMRMEEVTPQEMLAALRASTGTPTQLVAATAWLAALDPVRDVWTLHESRDVLAHAVRECGRADETTDHLQVVEQLLRLVSRRLSSVILEVTAYVEDVPRFRSEMTPAGIRAASLLSSSRRSLPELARMLDEDEEVLQQGLHRLISLGVVVEDAPLRPSLETVSYGLSPAGRCALPLIAKAVVEYELGRFPWPEDVPALDVWAEANQAEVFRFKREGRDGSVAASCFAMDPYKLGPLSAPSLVGLARMRSDEVATLAIFRSAPDTFEKKTSLIAADHRNVCERADRSDLPLRLFANDAVRARRDELESLFASEDVVVSFAA